MSQSPPDPLTTEALDPRYEDLDAWPFEKTLAALLKSNRRAVAAVEAVLPQLTQAAEGIAARLSAGGRLVYVGAGTSGRLAVQDAAELPPTFGFERSLVLMAGGNKAEGQSVEGAEDDEDEALTALAEAEVNTKDAVVGLAASGKTPYTVAGIRRARELGAFTVGVANNGGSPLLEAADVAVFLDTGPEVLAGSTRLAAGTSQKIVLNALSTSVLVRLGGAYGNLMVGMRPQNAKLRKRAVKMTSVAANASEKAAEDALRQADWQIREAVVMLKSGVALSQAKQKLQTHGGRVRDALEEP